MPGGANCAAQVCCPPPEHIEALAEMIFSWVSGTPQQVTMACASAIAGQFFARFDAVPAGWWPQCVAAVKALQAAPNA